jgi:hypothetical protein
MRTRKVCCDSGVSARVRPLLVGLVRPAGGVFRPAGWSPLECSENLMPSLVGLGHRVLAAGKNGGYESVPMALSIIAPYSAEDTFGVFPQHL